jgi:hypothetical protein
MINFEMLNICNEHVQRFSSALVLSARTVVVGNGQDYTLVYQRHADRLPSPPSMLVGYIAETPLDTRQWENSRHHAPYKCLT